MAMPKRVVVKGEKFADLTIMFETAPEPYKYDGHTKELRRFRCRCVCGNEIIAYLNNLTQSRSTNCGCKRRYGRN